MLDIGNTVLKAAVSGVNLEIAKLATVTSRGYNVSSDNGGGFLTGPGDQINTDPMLGPLQDNGGPTFTHALLPGSPAITQATRTLLRRLSLTSAARFFGACVMIASIAGHLKCKVGTTPSPTPTATPCASVGSWTEQAPYPIAVFGHAVASQGGDVYSFGGIANNVAIANAYKYTPATNSWSAIASLPAARYGLTAVSDGTYVYLLAAWTKTSTPRPPLALRPSQ